VLFFMRIHSRRVIGCRCTDRADSAWSANQVGAFVAAAERQGLRTPGIVILDKTPSPAWSSSFWAR